MALLALALISTCAPGAFPARAEEPADDTLYLRDLKAYRGGLTAQELQQLEEVDPGPSLYMGGKATPERAVARLFASLPDDAHAALRRTGYLKWRADSLPSQQRRWLREGARYVESLGEGPFPVEGKDAASTGFARVEIEGLDQPQYCWWIAAPKARRPAWITLVRAVGTLSQAYAEAHRAQLPETVKKPDTEPIPAGRWLKAGEAPAAAKPEAPPDEPYLRDVLRAYRGDLRGDALRALTEGDTMLARRLKLAGPADRGVHRFFAGLGEKEQRALLADRGLAWKAEQLSREQRKLLEPVVQRLNEGTLRDGGTPIAYTLLPYSGTTVGFTLVRVPDAEHPVVSWWIRSPFIPTPAWISLAGGGAADSPAYYQAHLEQVGR